MATTTEVLAPHISLAHSFRNGGSFAFSKTHSFIARIHDVGLTFRFRGNEHNIAEMPLGTFIAETRQRGLAAKMGTCFSAIPSVLAQLPKVDPSVIIVEDLIAEYKLHGQKGIRKIILDEKDVSFERRKPLVQPDEVVTYGLRLSLRSEYGEERYALIIDAIDSFKGESDYFAAFSSKLRVISDLLQLNQTEQQGQLKTLKDEIDAFHSSPTFERLQSIIELLKGKRIGASDLLASFAERLNYELDQLDGLHQEYLSEKGKTLSSVFEALFPGSGERIASDFAPIARDAFQMRQVQAFFPSPRGTNVDDVQMLGRRVVDVVSKHFATMSDQPVWRSISQESLRASFNAMPIGQQIPFEEVMGFLEGTILPHSMHFGHPRFIGQMHPAGTTMAIFAESLISALQENLIVREVSPTMSSVEDQLERWLCNMVGFGDTMVQTTGDRKPGVTFTVGGTSANLTALKVARNIKIGEMLKAIGSPLTVKKDGLVAASRALEAAGGPISFAMATSAAAHYSMEKIADDVGLGENAFIRVVADDHSHMRVKELEKLFRASRQKRRAILAVVATIGSTETGNVDPIMDIINVARNHNAWVHLDGAWGAPFMLSPRIRDSLFRGVELADSVTIDPHKMLHMPYSLGAAIFRDRNVLAELKAKAGYLFSKTDTIGTEVEEFRQLGQYSLLGSRRADALKLLMTLWMMGTQNFQNLFEHSIDMTKYWEAIIRRNPDELEPLSHVELNLFCFRFVPPQLRRYLNEINLLHSKGGLSKSQTNTMLATVNAELNTFNQRLQEVMLHEGHSYIAYDDLAVTSYTDGNPNSPNSKIGSLRSVLLNPFTRPEDLEDAYEDVLRIGNQVWLQNKDRIIDRLDNLANQIKGKRRV